MDNPRPEKVAVVDEVRNRLDGAAAALLTEYRGLSVAEMQELRRSLREAGGQYSIYKNTLVRFATRQLGLEIDDLLSGPTAIAFVPTGGEADPVIVAKALKDFGKANPNLVVKGGILGDKVLSAAEARALADVEPREVLLSQLAGAMAAPMQQLAGLMQALPRNLAFGLQALINQGGAAGANSGSAVSASHPDSTPAETDPSLIPTEEPAPTSEEPEVDAPDNTENN